MVEVSVLTSRLTNPALKDVPKIVVYKAECIKCEERQKAEGTEVVVKRVYFGKTNKIFHHRAGEHVNDHKREFRSEGRRTSDQDWKPSPSSWISDHAKKAHGGANGLDLNKDIRFTK